MDRRNFLCLSSLFAGYLFARPYFRLKPFKPGLVYIINDEKCLTELFRDSLNFHQYKIHPAGLTIKTGYDGIDGVKLMETAIPNLIITDINMPVMSGLDLVRYVRKRFSKPELPVITMSCYASEKSCYAAGSSRHLWLPVGMSELCLASRELLS
jgi:CheY-like chemotaxis protein